LGESLWGFPARQRERFGAAHYQLTSRPQDEAGPLAGCGGEVVFAEPPGPVPGADDGMAAFGVPVTEPPALVPDTPSGAEALLLVAPGEPIVLVDEFSLCEPAVVLCEPPCSVGRPQAVRAVRLAVRAAISRIRVEVMPCPLRVR
jgi:hypothetical protein